MNDLQSKLEEIREAVPKADSDYGNHYQIVSYVGYLLGVKEEYFEKDILKKDVYKIAEKNKQARIVRNLCALRTITERSYKQITQAARSFAPSASVDHGSMEEAMNRLREDGIEVFPLWKQPSKLIMELNSQIQDHINNCKELFSFALWLNWDYLREIFIMPNGQSQEGCYAAAQTYYDNLSCYPFRVYMNWNPSNVGNVLQNDKKFIILLYSWHGEEFTDLSLVSDVSSNTKETIYQYIEESTRVVFMVDCENSDPYRLCAALKGLDDEKLKKIGKIILFDDIHTTPTWEILERYVHIPIEYILVERVKEDKSLVDIKLAAGVCREHYKNDVDSFVIVSSDSDYWGLIDSLEDARFLIMMEHEKCSAKLRAALSEHDIFYCFIDDFYDGSDNGIRLTVLKEQITEKIREQTRINIPELLSNVMLHTRIQMDENEKDNFYKKHLKHWTAEIDEDGYLSILPKNQ
ncbi:MAG: hypothetical protein K6F35_08330 [Lachnospiraceae bacterium]|nr:hypothetical protein [Lachnospiraceae bacterium]